MHSNDSLSSSERDLLVTTLEQQGLSDAVSGDPATWRAGLACVAGSYAQHCSSLPEPMEPPSVSMEALLNLLSSTDELVNMNVFFSLGAHELTEHSELLECFDRKSPGCGESLAALTLCVSSPEMTLNGQTLDVQGPFYFLYDQAYFFEDQDYRNSCRPVSLPSRQEAARAAKACWTERESSRGANDSSSGMETQAAQASLSLLPHALQQWAHEQYPRLIPAPTSKSVPAPLSLDDFHLSDGCFIKAPWRLHQLHTLVHRCDAFGNTLAHKAIRLLDPGLLEFSLRHHRALATQANLAGVRPIDLLWNTSHSHHFIPLACILMSFAPDLAATLSPQGEPMLSRAFYRDIKFESSKLEYMTQLLDAGASFNGRYSNGDALWSTWGSLNTSPLIARIVLAMDRGWDINSTDRHGQTLAHVSSSLETLQALHRLGADMMLKDSQHRLPGYLIQDAHQRTLWEHYLLEHHLSSPQASPRRALSL
jgi:hypothetical protein